MAKGFQSGGSFLPSEPANFTNTDLPCNFVKNPTIGGSSSAAGSATIVDTTSAQTLSNKTLTSPIVGTFLDANSVNRAIYNSVAKGVTNASATALFDVARANNSYAGGVIFYLLEVTDGTDYQALTGVVTYAMVDKAGTGTFTITEVAGNQAKAVSTGTLTVAWTFVTGTAKGTVKLQTTTSLTATTNQVFYSVYPIAGAVTID